MWFALALTAGVVQAARNGIARSLSGKVAPAMNTWARFAFSLPFASLLVASLYLTRSSPALSASFLSLCAATALAQLLGNIALVAAFNRGGFAQAIVMHKLEVVFAALIGMVLFSEQPTALGWGGICTTAAGVLLMNFGRGGGTGGWRGAFHLDTAALLALLCGLLLVLASFFLKGAANEFAQLNPHVGSSRFEAAAHTLFHTTWIEVAILTVGLYVAQREQLSLVQLHWRRMLGIGVAGFSASLCWFWAYSIALVAYVKAVGQVESIFAVALGVVVWREHQIWRQLPGMLLVVVGIALVLLG